MLGSDFLSDPGLFGLFGFLVDVIGVVAAIEHQLAITELHDFVGHPIDEIAVVAHQKCRPLVVDQGIFQHLLRWNIEVVGGLIEHQQVAGAQQHQGEGQARFFTATELARLFEHALIGKAEIAQQ